ncbi:MAG: ABC1 kinase family protein [Armatimonadota bacterium]
MPSLFITKRELARAWQIIRVSGRFGLVPLIQATGVNRWFGFRVWWRRMERRFQNIPPPVRLRLALAELGTTFIKLGQVLSARSDLLPPDYLNELAKLQDEVPALPFEEMRPVFIASFGLPPETAFAAFDPVPVASASIGQVYAAKLRDGTDVMVKLQRPKVEEQVQTDLSLMYRVADLANRNPFLSRYDLPSLVREFANILQDELIYTLEAHNAETLAREMAAHVNIIFPQVCWEYTSKNVLTTVRIFGVKTTEMVQGALPHVDRQEISEALANSLLEQILLHGMFHGDPHPGNLLVTPDGKLAYLDTGMVGRMDRKTRELLIELSISIFEQDIDSILDTLQQLGVVMEGADMAGLRQDLSRLITKYYFLPRREFHLGMLLQRVNYLLFQHRIRMAYEFGLMSKALFQAEGVAQALYPDFDYNRAARPVIDEVRRRYYSFHTYFEDTVRELRGMRRQIVDLPRRLSTVLSHFERGTLRIRTQDELIHLKDSATNSLVNRGILTVLIFAMVLAGALLLAADAAGWVSILALVLLGLGGVMLVLLVIAVLRA